MLDSPAHMVAWVAAEDIPVVVVAWADRTVVVASVGLWVAELDTLLAVAQGEIGTVVQAVDTLVSSIFLPFQAI